MKTILFIPYHLKSHIQPTFQLGRVLQEEYKVVYAVPAKFEEFTRQQQFDCVLLESVPFGCGFESVMRKQEGSKLLWRDTLKDRRSGRITRHREKKLKEITDALKPAFIFLDMLSATDFILLYPYLKSNHTGIAIINPMLSTYANPGVPRIGSLLRPEQEFKIAIENLFVRGMFQIYHLKEWIRYLGNDNRSLVKREFERKQVPDKYRFANKNYTTIFFENIAELILAPEELEFPLHKKRSNQYYMGLLPIAAEVISTNNTVEEELIENLLAWKKNPRCRILYCAFGSMYGNASDLIYKFLQQLFAIYIEEYDLRIICAFADKENRFDSNGLQSNIRLYSWLPQVKILPHCDLFITHAGLGSVKESIVAGVPMLAYPFTRDWDSTGNAVKVDYHGIGLQGNIEKDNSEMIADKILEILNDSRFQKNIQQLKNMIAVKYSKEKVLDLLKILVKSTIE